MESVSFQIPAGYEVLRITEKALRNLLVLHKVEAVIIDHCAVALQEMLTNIVEDSYDINKGKMIEVKLKVDGKQFIAEIKDTFEPLNVSPGTIPVPDIQIGDYDMAIIKKFMDEVQYQQKDKKNVWTLTKRL